MDLEWVLAVKFLSHVTKMPTDGPTYPYLSCTVYILCFRVFYMLFFSAWYFFGLGMTKDQAQYGVIRSTEALGKLTRAHRQQRKLTLETISGLGNLSSRSLMGFRYEEDCRRAING